MATWGDRVAIHSTRRRQPLRSTAARQRPARPMRPTPAKQPALTRAPHLSFFGGAPIAARRRSTPCRRRSMTQTPWRKRFGRRSRPSSRALSSRYPTMRRFAREAHRSSSSIHRMLHCATARATSIPPPSSWRDMEAWSQLRPCGFASRIASPSLLSIGCAIFYRSFNPLPRRAPRRCAPKSSLHPFMSPAPS